MRTMLVHSFMRSAYFPRTPLLKSRFCLGDKGSSSTGFFVLFVLGRCCETGTDGPDAGGTILEAFWLLGLKKLLHISDEAFHQDVVLAERP